VDFEHNEEKLTFGTFISNMTKSNVTNILTYEDKDIIAIISIRY